MCYIYSFVIFQTRRLEKNVGDFSQSYDFLEADEYNYIYIVVETTTFCLALFNLVRMLAWFSIAIQR